MVSNLALQVESNFLDKILETFKIKDLDKKDYELNNITSNFLSLIYFLLKFELINDFDYEYLFRKSNSVKKIMEL